ncbi:MAG TPA: hypothetical protein VKV15_24390 [Bryobacteraceae bacterium]|nr:hypothetical protein [Bryobacteraceae bacterium]
MPYLLIEGGRRPPLRCKQRSRAYGWITPIFLLYTSGLYGQILAVHDYDPVSDTVVSWRIEAGRSASQSFHVTGKTRIGGFRVKLQRSGHPLPIEYRLGSSRCAADLASGTISADQVSPWFEHWEPVRFKTPLKPPGNRTLYLQLQLSSKSSDAYEWYGTASAAIARPEFHLRFPYPGSTVQEQRSIFENPANIDYGVRTKMYGGGTAFDGCDASLPALDFAFAIDGESPAAATGEERFAFVESITGPLYTHSLRRPQNRAGKGEIAIDSGWRLENRAPGIMVKIAAEEFHDFLRVAMQAPLKGTGSGSISVAIGCGTPPRKSEGFALNVRPASAEVCGYDERGAMRGLHYLEAQMNLRHGPFLPIGEERRAPLLSPRITSAPFYSRSEFDIPIDQYTDGLLERISRGGFNAIWVWGDLEDFGHSDVFPELDHGVAQRQAQLNRLISRAGRYGIDVYMQLANYPLPKEFFELHPDVRGSSLPVFAQGYVLCTSVPKVRGYMRSAVHNLASAAPGLKGLMLIVGGEGFLHCYTRKNTCPRCSRRTPQQTIAEFSSAIFEGARDGNPNISVALWPYSASNTWSKDDTTQSRLIARLPPGMTWLTEFAKEGAISFGGITIPAYDYPITIVGPSDRFAKQSGMARDRGLGLWVKTEHAIALEFIQTPYIPVFFQWAERFHHINTSPGVSAEFANWMHYGFMPGRATDLFYWNIWEYSEDAETTLRRIATRDFGEAASGYALRAWRLFSDAIQQYPFSGPMAMGVVQKGPAHPLFFDPNYRPRHGSGRQFKNDLTWTRPWGPELAISQMEKMERLWTLGFDELLQAERAADPADRPEVHRELGVAAALLACIRSTAHVGRFYMLREQLQAATDKKKARDLLDSMIRVAQAEIRNAREALPYVRADSRLGYANSGKGDQSGVSRAGIYSPGSIEKKIAQVERMLHEEIPAYRQAKGLD